MSPQIVRSLPADRWRMFVDGHPQGNVFHTPEMFQIFSETRGYHPELWASVEDDQVLALFMPVHISLQNGRFRRLTTRSVSFGSVLSLPGEYGYQALEQLLRAYKAGSGKESLFTELRNISPRGDLLPLLRKEGFAYEEHLNYLIDLDRPPEAVFKSIGKRTQRNIKRALHKALAEISVVTEKTDLKACYSLLEMTYRAARVPLADYSVFEAAFDILRPKRMVRFTLAKVDENPAAVSIELLHKDVIYGWYGGMDRKYTPFVPNELLMWHILKWGAENGFKQYDFGGAGKPQERYGVRDFKAKFGGELVCYGRNTWIPHQSLFLLAKAGFGLLRRYL